MAEAQCAICLEGITPGAPGTITLECGHPFHYWSKSDPEKCCLSRWHHDELKNSCPTCREPIDGGGPMRCPGTRQRSTASALIQALFARPAETFEFEGETVEIMAGSGMRAFAYQLNNGPDPPRQRATPPTPAVHPGSTSGEINSILNEIARRDPSLDWRRRHFELLGMSENNPGGEPDA